MINSAQIIDRLKVHYPKTGGFVFIEQVANTTGFASRFADAIAMNVWKSRFEIIGIEVKVSRSDWLNEIKQPEKADKIFQYCHSWYIATPKDLIRDGELPNGWGWLEVGDNVKTRVPSSRNQHQKLDDFFVASVIRRVMEQATPEADLQSAEQLGYRRGQESVREAACYEAQRLEEELKRLKKTVRDYESASGLTLHNGWGNTENIGQAVKLVLSGKHQNVKDQLERVKSYIEQALKDV